MPATLYALLVGIDDYAAPVPYLRGCVNDIRSFEALLHARATDRTLALAIKVLVNAEATRAAVIDGFLTHLGRAAAGDTALFYFSGHGSQQPTPAELRDLEPDGLDETLVCFDSRTPGGYELADKELASLIRYVARQQAHVAIVLDCCHSGSGTRALVLDAALVRQAPAVIEPRMLETFFVSPGDEAPAGAPLADTWRKPAGRHVVWSACRDDEEAKETVGITPQRGAFSFFLTEALSNTLHTATYRDLFNQVNARVRSTTSRQSPVMEAVVTADMDRPFLGGAIQPHRPYFTMRCVTGQGWVLDAGSVQGIPPVAGLETTLLALFPAAADLDPIHALPTRTAEARVTQVLAFTCKVALDDQAVLDETLTYKAVITALPMPPMGVKMTGLPEALQAVRAQLATLGPIKGPSLFVAESDAKYQLLLTAEDGRYRVQRAGDDQSLAVDVPQGSADAAARVAARLEHLARWIRTLELRNPSPRLPAGSLEMKVFATQADGSERLIGPGTNDASPRLEYRREGEAWVPAEIRITLANRSARRLYCGLLDLPGTFGIQSLLPGGWLLLEPGAEQPAIVGGLTQFDATIPKTLLDDGVVELGDTLKAIACTGEWDPTLLELPDLDVASVSRGDAPKISNSFTRLMSRVGTRQISAKGSGDDLTDWTTAECTLTIVRPLDEVPVPDGGASVPLATGVTLLGHDGLSATARLAPEAAGSRDARAEASPVPPWLAGQPGTVRAFQFGSARGDTAPLSVLELGQVTGAETVTAANPLIVQSDGALADDELLLPYAFDGEFYLPVGFAQSGNGTTAIHITRLPTPNARSLNGSLRIFFKKVISGYLGTEYPYPLLSAVGKTAEGKLEYGSDPALVADRVAAAKKIVLYIHGIIGDTQAMTASAFGEPGSEMPIRLAGEVYDLVLAFDYENLNTPIEQTARDLKQRLAAVGLGAGGTKELHIVAHSMGGLVARWFVEQEEGNAVVSRLTMLGTPNGGSPWSAYEQWFSTMLSVGLNGLSQVHWPPTVLGGLMRGLTWVGKTAVARHGQIEVALGQMHSGSEFLQALANSPDPHVPYVVVAGNTSVALAAMEGGESSRIARLLERVSPKDVLYRTVALAFFNLPNDIAVAVSAIESLPGSYSLIAAVHEVGCDHVSYFETPAALAWIVAGAQG